MNFDGKTYIPVYSAPSNASKLIPVKTTISGPVNTFKLGNVTYIPKEAVPKEVLPVFKPKKLTPTKVVININGENFVPVKASNNKPVVIEGKTYIPVKKATEKQISSNTPIKPNKEGPIDTFKVGNVTYIPLNVVPKKFTPLFKKKIPVTPTTPTVSRPNNATHVINVNG